MVKRIFTFTSYLQKGLLKSLFWYDSFGLSQCSRMDAG